MPLSLGLDRSGPPAQPGRSVCGGCGSRSPLHSGLIYLSTPLPLHPPVYWRHASVPSSLFPHCKVEISPLVHWPIGLGRKAMHRTRSCMAFRYIHWLVWNILLLILLRVILIQSTAFQVMWFWRERARSKKSSLVLFTDRRNLPYALHSVQYVSKSSCGRVKYFSYFVRMMLRRRTLALSKIASIRFKSSFGNWTLVSPKTNEWRCNSIIDVCHSFRIRSICDSSTLSLTRTILLTSS